jgi:branched-chain amino acid transport system substrate-binding protein
MQQRVRTTWAAALVLALALAAGAPGAGAQAKTFKFGAILGLTGPAAAQGTQFRRGVEMAIDVWNKERRGVNGTMIEGIFEDHALQAARAVTAARKLIDVDKVVVFANVYSGPVLAVAPIADQARVLQMSAGANSPRLVNASRYFLSNIANAALEAEVGLAFARRTLGVERLALIFRNDDFGNGTREIAAPVWQRLGGQMVIVEGHEPDQREFATLVAKVAAARPQAIYIASSGGNQGILVRQLREGGLDIPIVSYQGLEVPELFSVAGRAAENAYWTSSAAAEDQTRFRAYAKKFREKYSEDPLVFSNTHYDMAASVFQAASDVARAKQPIDGTTLREAMLKRATFVGVLGPFTYRGDGTALRALDLKTARDGRAVTHMAARQIQQQGIYNFGPR